MTRRCLCNQANQWLSSARSEFAPRVLHNQFQSRLATGRIGRTSTNLERRGLIMYGQMTAGSWIYIGSQGIVQGSVPSCGARRQTLQRGTLSGKLVITGGLGGMGGAQPLATSRSMDAVCLGGRGRTLRGFQRRVETGYCDRMTHELSTRRSGLVRAEAQKKRRAAFSVGLVGNCAEVLPELVRQWRGDRYRHRSNQRARSAGRLHPGRGLSSRRGGRCAAGKMIPRIRGGGRSAGMAGCMSTAVLM